MQTLKRKVHGRGVILLLNATSLQNGNQGNQITQEKGKIVLQLLSIGTVNGTMLDVPSNYPSSVKLGHRLTRFVH